MLLKVHFKTKKKALINLVELNSSIRSSTNDQLLAKCSAILQNGENESGDMEDEEEEEDAYTACIASLSPNTLTQLANQLNGSSTGNNGKLAAGSAALAAAACKALLFGAKKEDEMLQQNEDEHMEQQRLVAANSVVAATTPTNFIVRKTINSNNCSPAMVNRASPGGGKLSSTQCSECGKHLRKRRHFILGIKN